MDTEPTTEQPLDAVSKAEIDAMSYTDMLRRVRFDPTGSKYFVGAVGEYFGQVMKVRSAACTHEERVAASKRIGW